LHLVDGAGVVLHANQASLDLLGYSEASEYIGQPFGHVFADPAEAAAIVAALCSSENVKARPATILAGDGEQKSVLIEANACFEGDYFQYGRVLMQEITGLVLTDRPTQLKHEVLKVLAESSTTNEAMSRLVPTIARAVGCNVGLAWRADVTANRLERLFLWRAEPHGEADHFLSGTNNISINLSSGFPAEFWFSDRAHKIVAGKDILFCGSEMALSLPQYKEIISVPIAIGRINWGLMGFFAQAESAVTPVLLTQLEALGSQIGQFIERQQAFENYQKMQESYSLAIAGANEGIWDWDFGTNEVFFRRAGNHCWALKTMN
jgi:PAS domain-containing protein